MQAHDAAEVLEENLPSSLGPGETYEAQVTMRNTGTTTWTEEGQYRLGAVDNSDPLGPGACSCPRA